MKNKNKQAQQQNPNYWGTQLSGTDRHTQCPRFNPNNAK